jgi:hypothetical protein
VTVLFGTMMVRPDSDVRIGMDKRVVLTDRRMTNGKPDDRP